VARLEPAATRVIDTGGSAEATRIRVRAALDEALARRPDDRT
jgi:hypothetical protein